VRGVFAQAARPRAHERDFESKSRHFSDATVQLHLNCPALLTFRKILGIAKNVAIRRGKSPIAAMTAIRHGRAR
jgi:hypothetical protein